MSRLNRRDFLTGSLATGAAFALPHSRVLGANEDIRVAVIGFNGQGGSHIGRLLDMKGVRLVALCDVDPAVLAKGVSRCEAKGQKPTAFSDVRKLLESKEIDAITTATPNHWHSLIGVWACQAGKDAYIEKPISHNVWEGRQVVKAARKYNRVVQGGTQSRSNGQLKEAVQWVRDGNLGKIKVVYGCCYKPRKSIGKLSSGTTGKIPEGLDYNLWTGPAPLKPLTREKLHYDWHWVHDTGNGDMGNQGIHQMDIARWFIGEPLIAPRVISVGARLGYDDDAETPNTQVCYYDYAKAPLIFETRGLPKAKEFQESGWTGANMDTFPGASMGRGIGVVVECEGGRVVDGSGVAAYDNDGKKIKEFKGIETVPHMDNFIAAVRERKPSMLNADCLETHISSALCHQGMISHLLGKRMSQGEIKERINGDSLLAARFEDMKEHLGRNGLDISSSVVTLGPWVKFDPKAERAEDDRANALVSRKYREPFVVPKEV